MVVKKKTFKTPAVRVETRKLSNQDACSTSSCSKMKAILVLILLLLNTVLIVFVLVRQTSIEAERVGGKANLKMVKEIYKTDMFKQQQTQQIQEALQMYQWAMQDMQQMPMMMPETDQFSEDMMLE